MTSVATENKQTTVSYLMGLRLDKGIRDIVITLNQLGYQTYFSCAGHYPDLRGRLQFQRGPDHKATKDILASFGLKGIRIRDLATVSEYGQEQGITEATQATFDPIGLTSEQRHQQIMKRGIQF